MTTTELNSETLPADGFHLYRDEEGLRLGHECADVVVVPVVADELFTWRKVSNDLSQDYFTTSAEMIAYVNEQFPNFIVEAI